MHPPLDVMIDDAGRRWQTRGEELLCHLGAGRPDYNLELFLVVNMGFVRVRRSRENLIVTLAPPLVQQPTFDALAWLLVDLDPSRTAIHSCGDTDGIEVISDPEEAVLRLDDLCFGHARAARGSSEEELSIDRLQAPRLRSLRCQMQAWAACRGELADLRTMPQSLVANGRLLAVRMERGGPRVQHVQGYRFSGTRWSENMLGRSIEEAPDPDYAQLVAQALRRTLAGGAPRLELVDAFVGEAGANPNRFRYDRLMLPWRAGGITVVTTSSVSRLSPIASSVVKA